MFRGRAKTVWRCGFIAVAVVTWSAVAAADMRGGSEPMTRVADILFKTFFEVLRKRNAY